ncbi:hypothetical protein ACWDUN_14990 [Mycobacterium sp. NPDC003323]
MSVPPATAAPPVHGTAPAVALTATSAPLDITLPELIEHVDTFTELITPIFGSGGGTTVSPAPNAAALPIEFAHPISSLIVATVRAVVGTVYAIVRPALDNDALNAIVAPPFFAFMLLSSFIGTAAASVAMLIEDALAGVVKSIGGLFGPPAAALSGAVAVPASGSSAQAAKSADVTEPAPVDADPVIENEPPQREPFGTETDDVVVAETTLATEESVSTEAPAEDGAPTEADATEPEDALGDSLAPEASEPVADEAADIGVEEPTTDEPDDDVEKDPGTDRAPTDTADSPTESSEEADSAAEA